MKASSRVRLAAAGAVGVLGVLAAAASTTLPWLDPEFTLSAPVRLLMALAGATILVIAALPGRRGARSVRAGSLVLGLTVLSYPSTLSLAAAETGGPVIGALGVTGHVTPLVLVQLLPVLAVGAVTGRPRRAWVAAILAAAVIGGVATALSLAGVAPRLSATVSNVLWLGSFALAPVATWSAVRGTTGLVRRRAIVAALASVVPVVVIAACRGLGAAADTQGLSTDASTAALMCGFSLGTLSSAALAAVATGPPRSPLLERRPITTTLAVLLVATTVLLGTGAALLTLDAGLAPPAALLGGVVVAVGVGIAVTRLFRWAARAIDPVAELTDQLLALGEIADGEHRQTIQLLLRRSTGDPDLVLVVRAADGSWLDSAGTPVPSPADAAVALAGPDGAPTAVALTTRPDAVVQLRRLGDGGATLLREAVIEATVLRERSRADTAARDAQTQLSQDLHDGLQGRLLGLALNLQLSGRQVEDPTARLLIEETVASLRNAVEEVRGLAGGRLPATLVDGGLRPALADLVGPLTGMVDLQVPERRFPPTIEAAGYFVVSEAVSNALKHARAERVQVRIDSDAERLTIQVSDDGVGGADPRRGSGLRGLAERVAATGGVLVVRDHSPRGTVVEASLPCGS